MKIYIFLKYCIALFSESFVNIGALSDLQRGWPNKKVELGNLLVKELNTLIYHSGKVEMNEESTSNNNNTTADSSSTTNDVLVDASNYNQLLSIVKSIWKLGQLTNAMQEMYRMMRFERKTSLTFIYLSLS